jgi:phage N-6-adenine-methyltransferase
MNIGRTAEPQITHYAPIDATPPRHEPVEDEEEKAEWWHRPEEEPAEVVRNSEVSPVDYKPTVLLSSDEKYDGNEWYTPKEWIEAARVLYGGVIDLDPASCEEAQHVVQATTYYTKDQDGLSLPWIGNVWCNPPYSFPEVQLFARKAAREYAIGNATSVLMLVNNCTDAGWFVELSKASRVVMFSLGRASFWRPNQQTFATRQGQALFYIGPNPGKCVDAFSHIAYTLPNAH